MFKIGRFDSLYLFVIAACVISGLYSCPAGNAFTLAQIWPRLEPRYVSDSKIATVLASHDTMLLIDRSKSMNIVDCPLADAVIDDTRPAVDSQSRWDWCRDQALHLAKQTQGVLNKQVRVVTFGSYYHVYDGFDLANISKIFKVDKPHGGTNATLVIKNQLADYFARKAELGDRMKPLLIAVITDGGFNDVISLQCAIADATRQLSRRDEVAITFLQIGNDPRASDYITNLNDSVMKRRAVFDIVTTRTFSELQKIGLGQALVEAVTAVSVDSTSQR